MKLLLAIVLASHLTGPAGRPPITVDCDEIRPMIEYLKLVRDAATNTPDVRSRANRLIKFLKFYKAHECRKV